MFQQMKTSVMGNRKNPRNHTIPNTEKIKITKRIEFVRPDLNDNNGNLAK